MCLCYTNTLENILNFDLSNQYLSIKAMDDVDH